MNFERRSPLNTTWTTAYPDRTALKREVRAMVEAIRAALLDELGERSIRGMYFKGSAQRPWESLLDYVPELSDVDVHVWLHREDAATDAISLDAALRVQAAIERAYAERVPEPLHFPRPQIILLNALKREPRYVPPAAGMVEVLVGEALPDGEGASPDEILRMDAANLMDTAEAVAQLPMQVIDRPGRYSWTSLRNLSWRVSPAGPRVLDLLGMDPDEAWSINRTNVDAALRERGQSPLADKLAEYYLSAWDYFLSDYQDTDAARRTIRAGASAITLAAQIAASMNLEYETLND